MIPFCPFWAWRYGGFKLLWDVLFTPYKFLYIVLLRFALFEGETWFGSLLLWRVTFIVGSYYWCSKFSVSSSMFIKCLFYLYRLVFLSPPWMVWAFVTITFPSKLEFTTMVSRRWLSIWSGIAMPFWDLPLLCISSFLVLDFEGVCIISFIGSLASISFKWAFLLTGSKFDAPRVVEEVGSSDLFLSLMLLPFGALIENWGLCID